MINDFIKIFGRDLDRLKDEIELFQDESNLWRTTGSIKNSAGNLCLHLVGNLRTYIGKNIGNDAYIRDRDGEFSRKGIAKQTLVDQVAETKAIVLSALQRMNEVQLEEPYVENVLGYPMTHGFFLVHLAAHFSYHLGQINYLRRALE
jgi:uncharacterized damage-inducible protein DinB